MNVGYERQIKLINSSNKFVQFEHQNEQCIGRLLIFLRRARIIILILKLLITFLRRFKINSIECQVTVLSKGDMPA